MTSSPRALARPVSRRTILGGAASLITLGSTAVAADALGITPSPRPLSRRATLASSALPTGATALAMASGSRITPGNTHAWDGLEPAFTSTYGWKFEIPANATPPNPRRSEAWWSVDGSLRSYGEGQIAVYEAEVMGRLGAAGFSTHDWHLLWQLQGPHKDGSWGPPAVTLGVNDGHLNMQGGDGHPNHRPGVTSYWWRRDMAPWVEGQYYRVRIEVLVSADPAKGWLSVWCDGRQVLNRWNPVSSSGLRPGTMYPNMTRLNTRSALYRGSYAGYSAPTYQQRSFHRNIAIH